MSTLTSKKLARTAVPPETKDWWALSTLRTKKLVGGAHPARATLRRPLHRSRSHLPRANGAFAKILENNLCPFSAKVFLIGVSHEFRVECINEFPISPYIVYREDRNNCVFFSSSSTARSQFSTVSVWPPDGPRFGTLGTSTTQRGPRLPRSLRIQSGACGHKKGAFSYGPLNRPIRLRGFLSSCTVLMYIIPARVYARVARFLVNH